MKKILIKIFMNLIYLTLLFAPITLTQAFIKCTYQGKAVVFACNHDGNPDPLRGKDNMWTIATCDEKGKCRAPSCISPYCLSGIPDSSCQKYYPVSEGGDVKAKMKNSIMGSSGFMTVTKCQLNPKL